jgi:endonuclease/exonuclease/phosphatase family metal-dependent hydrolase
VHRLLLLLCIVNVSVLFAAPGPDLLTYDEIIQLYQQDTPPPQLVAKLQRLLTTPFVDNSASEGGVTPVKPVIRQVGPVLRVAQWNIERGLEFDLIQAAFSDPKKFASLIEDKDSKADDSQAQHIREQVEILKAADLVVLNEVDWGINRTLFRNVAADLASSLHMNYAYGVEFVEVDPITMGLDQDVMIREVKDAYSEPGDDKSDILARVKEVMKPDPARYRGLHGTAILSRYPLSDVKVIPFQTQGHDWYTDEKNRHSPVAKAQGKAGEIVFKEQIIRQVRRGGRMMLLADLASNDFPDGRVTVVATHLEDESAPDARREQLEEVLRQIAPIRNPVILVGDMNTSAHDGVPTTVGRMLKNRLGSGKWWVEEGVLRGVGYATPYGMAAMASKTVVSFVRSVDDPTEKSLPVIGINPEAKFFSTLQKFRFDDGGRFDFEGEPERTSNGRAGKLANSNERSEKGFVPTNELGQKFGPLGQFKLDWIFVKPGKLSASSSSKVAYPLTPCFARTLRELNHSVPGRISDHSPITADLPLGAAGVETAAQNYGK